MEEIKVPSFANDNYEKLKANELREEKRQEAAKRRNRIVACRKLLAILAGGVVIASIPAFRNGAKEVVVKIEKHYQDQNDMHQEWIEKEVYESTGRTIDEITESGKQIR